MELWWKIYAGNILQDVGGRMNGYNGIMWYYPMNYMMLKKTMKNFHFSETSEMLEACCLAAF